MAAVDDGIKYGTLPKAEPGPFEAFPVYGLLSVQLLVTVLFCAICMYYEPMRQFSVDRGFVFSIVGIVGLLGTLIACFFVKDKFPWNVLCLVGITVFMTMIIGVRCALYEYQARLCQAQGLDHCSHLGLTIWAAWGITFVIFLSLTAFTVFSKIDFSFLSMWLTAGALIMVGWALLNMIFGWHPSFLYGACGALLMSGFICYDTFQILERLSVDDWLIACVELYLDVVNLFSYILAMIGARDV